MDCSGSRYKYYIKVTFDYLQHCSDKAGLILKRYMLKYLAVTCHDTCDYLSSGLGSKAFVAKC